MKRILVSTILAIATLTILGCGNGGSRSPNIVARILSDATLDGDITKAPVTGSFTIAQTNTQFLLAGIDSVVGESRAFLDFPLNGTNNGVPLNVTIVSATLDIFINRYQSSASSVPMLIELVSFPTTLSSGDYNSTPLVSTSISFSVLSTDVGQHVFVDVKPLMVEAQRLGLQNFQVRILENFGQVIPGLIEINDTTGPNSSTLAPLLEVTYF